MPSLARRFTRECRYDENGWTTCTGLSRAGWVTLLVVLILGVTILISVIFLLRNMRHAKQRRAESEAALAAEFEPYGAPPGGPPNAGMASTQSGPFMAWPAQLLSAGARPDSRRSSSICYPERKHASASAAAKSKFETWSDVEAPYSAKNATAALPSSQQLPPMSPMEHALLHTSSADTLPHLPVLTKPEPAQARHGSQHHSLPAAAVHGQPEVSVSPASGNKTTFSEKSCAHNTDKRWDGISYLDYKFSGNPQSPPPIAENWGFGVWGDAATAPPQASDETHARHHRGHAHRHCRSRSRSRSATRNRDRGLRPPSSSSSTGPFESRATEGSLPTPDAKE